MLTPDEEQARLESMAAMVAQRARAAFNDMMQRIGNGETPRDAIAAVTATFAGEYYQDLSVAFSEILQRTVGVADIKRLTVGKVALSERLYRHTAEVNAATDRIIREHAKGFTQARELAMQLYEGYEFKVDPLAVKARLPKYLRAAMRDPSVSHGLDQIFARARAAELKTPALRAAYLQAIDEVERGAGMERLRNVIKTAWYERNRYFANRIAQTELHRVYEDQKAVEVMDDDGVEWVQVRMSATHPRVDICDFHARLDRYGQGPGVYPKAVAPKPPFHPFCLCRIVFRHDIDADIPQRERNGADRIFMRSLSQYDQRLVAGSRERLQRFHDGETIESIHDQATRKEYRLKRVGDAVKPLPGSD